MDIIVGNIYIDCVDKDIVKVIKVVDDIISFDILSDPEGLHWAGTCTDWFHFETFSENYTLCGALWSALYE